MFLHARKTFFKHNSKYYGTIISFYICVPSTTRVHTSIPILLEVVLDLHACTTGGCAGSIYWYYWRLCWVYILVLLEGVLGLYTGTTGGCVGSITLYTSTTVSITATKHYSATWLCTVVIILMLLLNVAI